jgi:ribonuclease HI
MTKLTIHCDGLCEPNPGRASWAFVVFDETGASIDLDCGYLGDGKTNNYAEYTAVGKAACWCFVNAKNKEIEIFTDSMLVVNQVTGAWNCNEKLKPLKNRVIELFDAHGDLTLSWVKGTENKADILTRKAYLDAVGIYPKPRIKNAA